MEIVATINGMEVNISMKLLAVLEPLIEARKGGFAYLKSGVFTSGREEGKATIANVWFNSCFSYTNLLDAKVLALTEMNGIDGVDPVLFSSAKAELIASAMKTLEGVREDAHRKGHDRCYLRVCDGVKIHYITEKNNISGLMEPVLASNGKPTAKSIQVSALEVARKVVEEGVYKKVNSRPLTLAKKAIEKALKAKGIKTPKTFTLQPDKFDSLSIDGNCIPVDAVTDGEDD